MKKQNNKSKKQKQERKKQTSQIIKAIAIVVIVFLILFVVDNSLNISFLGESKGFSMFDLVSGELFTLAVVIIIYVIIALVIAISAIAGWITDLLQADSSEIFTYVVNTWQPPSGGTNCLKCNDLRYGCSEYQCHSSGKACEWVNNELESGICVWDNPNDNSAPIITPDPSYLETGYVFTPNNAISPPEKGVFLIYQQGDNGCIEPFTNLTLGIYTNEPAVCKVDVQRQPKYEDMRFQTKQGNMPAYNHTIFLPSSAFPSVSVLGTLNITLDQGTYDNKFYFRCEDVNGNSNTANFLIEFCVEEGPDLTPPIIKGTSFTQNPAYVSYNTTESFFEVYTNEPADCKWDFQDLEYNDMSQNMSWCSYNFSDIIGPTLDYGCNGTFTGIINEESTNYYIKCKDQPWLFAEPNLRNTNPEPYIVTILGAPPLVINKILINDKENGAIIKGATSPIELEFKVTTSAGADDGNAVCSYKLDDTSDFVDFIDTGTTISTQNLWYKGDSAGIQYNLPIKCEDIAGNKKIENATFTVETDMTAPEVVRVYKENSELKIITNEPAECVYAILADCNYNFDEGVLMRTSNDYEHFLDWNTEITYYIKCKDQYGNKPIVNNNYVCSIIVKGSDYGS